MHRHLLPASVASILVLGLAVGIAIRKDSDVDSGEGRGPDASDSPLGAASAAGSGSLSGNSGGAPFAMTGEAQSDPSSGVDDLSTRRRRGAPGSLRGTSKGSSAPEGGGSTSPARVSEAADASAPSDELGGQGILQGGRLSALLGEALAEGDLGTLQGLLISGLTEKGTRFGAEDLPQLFEALQSVDDFGIEKLLLTHLERSDAPLEEKLGGYLDYLENAEKPRHVDDVFSEIVRLGGDEAVEGCMALARDPSREGLRKKAVEALGQLEDARAVPVLRDGLLEADEPRNARPYAQALARVGGAEALGTLVGHVSRVGNEAMVGFLKDIVDPDAGPILSEGLLDRSSAAYQKAALARLKGLQDPRTLRDLERFLGEASGTVLRDAVDTIGRILDSKSVRILEEFAARQSDPKVALQAVRTAARLKDRLDRGETKPGSRT